MIELVLLIPLLAAQASSAEVPAVPATDAEIEVFLDEGTVVHSEEIGSGITRPLRLELELDGVTMTAAFKNVNVHRTKTTYWKEGPPDLAFSDDYRYERVAYFLDRELGMGMVPVAVIRKVDGSTGAVVQWVGNAISEHERRESRLVPSDPLVLIRQQSIMRVFDALIYNDDRNLANQLITVDDWKLHLIDHSRSFRLTKTLPPGFMQEPVTVPRGFVPKLEALDAGSLKERMEGLLSKAQIKALLARRDKLLDKIEQDREKYGDAMVFQEFPESAPPGS